MIPEFIPEGLANGLSTVVEAIIALMLFIPKYRQWGGLGFALLMVAFLPIHVWDVLREDPVVGPAPAPQIRLVLQFLLIYAGWRIFKAPPANNN